jgi:hypothetical protein
MSNDAIAKSKKKHHLGIPIVCGQGPAVVEEQRLPCAPILVKDLGTVLGDDRAHV